MTRNIIIFKGSYQICIYDEAQEELMIGIQRPEDKNLLFKIKFEVIDKYVLSGDDGTWKKNLDRHFIKDFSISALIALNIMGRVGQTRDF